MRLAANVTMLFTDLAVLQRPAGARAAGFDGIEVLFPYEESPEDWRDALEGMPVALINTPPGDWASGERGWAAVPGEAARFREDFERALAYARTLGADHIHVLSGNASGPLAEETLIENLCWAVARAPGQSLTLEPLNPMDMPGYFLAGFDEAARIIARIGLAEVGLQVDLWHIRRLGLDPMAVWQAHGACARHVQIAGAARRGPPDAQALSWIARILPAYGGWIAAEYLPEGKTGADLGWMARARSAISQA
jgi:2-dehydrotetronate isomerase